jgi:glycosyltransferase involved in cell wall biosynthesis
MNDEELKNQCIEHPYVDEEWYLQEHPDVAAAGVNAKDHYTVHGIREGRFPKALRARVLEDKIWKGFSNYGLAALQDTFAHKCSDPTERLYAALALARWHSSRNEWKLASLYADYITSAYPLPGFMKHEGAEIIVANIHIKNGNHKAAFNVIEGIDLSITNHSDQLLLIANSLTKFAIETSGPLSLGPINKIFATANLKNIQISSTQRKFSFGDLLNLSTASKVKSPKKISILMPAYNAARYITLALDGLLKQTWINIEIIVVDDASSDETSAIVANLKKTDNRVKLLRHEYRRGAYASRNTALAAATGEFAVNHDSDDWSHPERLELMIRPLLDDTSKEMSICSWVRVDSEFMFIKPRPDLRMIHPSISTGMIRLKTLKKLGGWDEVKVAADSEMLGRIIAAYGPAVIETVLQEIPLVFSRETENSLTTAPQTHWRSDFFGLRNLYRQSYEQWHRLISEKDVDPFINSKTDEKRAFFCPASNLISRNTSNHYDLVIYADLSSPIEHEGSTYHLISNLSTTAVRFALFHWPDYTKSNFDKIDGIYLELANDGAFDFLSPTQYITTENLILLNSGNLEYHPDSIPQVKFKKICSLAGISHAREIIDGITTHIAKSLGEKLRALKIFDSDWYISIYPDVRKFNSTAIDHFISHGLYEGRQISPEVCLDYYRERYLKHNSTTSPLLHYLNKGHFLGYSVRNPIIIGHVNHNPKKPNILACAHASNTNIFGAERSFLDTLKVLHSIGYNLIVTLPTYANKDYVDSVARYSTSVYIVPYPLWTQSKSPNNWAINRLETIISEKSVNLVYSNTLTLREPLLAAKNQAIPSIVHAHEIFEELDPICTNNNILPHQIYNEIRGLSTIVIANSKFTASFLEDASFRATVIPNSIDFSTRHTNVETNSKTLKVGIISSNIEKKGLSDFFKLASKIEAALPDVRFVIIGPSTQHLESLLNCAPANLEHVGYTSSSIEAVAMLDIVLNLSLCQETFGRTMLEGMAAGKIVIAYDKGALPELIDHGSTGYIVDYRDLDALSKIIINLYNDRAKLITIGNRAKLYVKRNFSEEIIKKTWRATFKKALS